MEREVLIKRLENERFSLLSHAFYFSLFFRLILFVFKNVNKILIKFKLFFLSNIQNYDSLFQLWTKLRPKFPPS